ncbi:hypothetical protein Q9Q94_16335 [Uliginosibacterium sp. 31-16]|nr:hypothetical protein [Uliginosibacterium sp. 31-16]MDP5241111.1 hypothetical protein [Uliginosibacterium sp. 31-16]
MRDKLDAEESGFVFLLNLVGAVQITSTQVRSRWFSFGWFSITGG